MTVPALADQASLESTAKQVFADGMAVLAEYIATPGADPEVVVKILNSPIKDVAKVVPEKKADPHAGLPVFHITINNGRITAQAVTPELQAVDTVIMEVEPPLPLPSPAPKRVEDISADLLQDLADAMELLP